MRLAFLFQFFVVKRCAARTCTSTNIPTVSSHFRRVVPLYRSAGIILTNRALCLSIRFSVSPTTTRTFQFKKVFVSSPNSVHARQIILNPHSRRIYVVFFFPVADAFNVLSSFEIRSSSLQMVVVVSAIMVL